MPSGDSSGATVGTVAALLLVVGVVASAIVLKKQGIIGKDNPGLPRSGVTADPEAHLKDIKATKQSGKQTKLAKTKSDSQKSQDKEMAKDSGMLPKGTQLGKSFSPLKTDLTTKSVEIVAVDNENQTSERKPETPKKSEKPSFVKRDSKQKLEHKSISTEKEDSNTAKGKTSDHLGSELYPESVLNSRPPKQQDTSKPELDARQMATVPPKPPIPTPRKTESSEGLVGIRGGSVRKSLRGVAKQRSEPKPEPDANVGRTGRKSVRGPPPPKQPTNGSSDLVKTKDLPKEAKELAENKELLEKEYDSILEYVRLNIKKESTVAKQEEHNDHNRYTDIGKY